MKIFQKGFNYSQDGPGNRLVYHLAGCNMRCPWCSNPEGMSVIEGSFFEMSPRELVQEALSSKPMFFDGGGVTFTGGECTLQFGELFETLKILKSNGINTCIETNGTSERLVELSQYIDHVIIDLKHPDFEKHKAVTGIGNAVTKQNIKQLCDAEKNLLIRVPLINGFNTERDDIERFVEFFEGVKGENVSFELLKYHEYGKDKWEKLGLEYTVQNGFVDDTLRKEFEEKMKRLGLNVVRT